MKLIVREANALPAPPVPLSVEYAKTFYCPDIVSQQDGVIVQQTLLNAPGIDEVSVDHVVHTVFVSINTKEGLADVENRLSQAGFPATEREEGAMEPTGGNY